MKSQSFLTARSAMLRLASFATAFACLFAAPAAHAAGGITASPVVVQFPATAVGSTSTAVVETVTISGYGGPFTFSQHYSKDYYIGTPACTGTGAVTCTISVYFRPTLPGFRKEALFVFSNSTRIGSILFSGIGQSPLAALQPGITTTPAGLAVAASGNAEWPLADENGVVYFYNGPANSIQSCAPGCTTATTLVSNAGHIFGLSIDGAGVLYWGPAGGPAGTTINTYDTVQNIQGTFTMPASDVFLNATVDGMGDVFAIGTNSNNIYKVLPSGASTTTAINPAITQPYYSNTDSTGNLFIGGYTINELTPTGTQTQIANFSNGGGLGVDAADTLYISNTSGILELAPSNYASTAYTYSAFANTSVTGVTSTSSGTMYVGSYSGSYEINRSQDTIAFGAQNEGVASGTQTVNMLNVGNQPLIISNVALTGAGYQLQTAATSPCGSTITLAAGASCNIAVNFSSPNAGNYPGSIVVTSNSLNNTSSTSTVTLSAYIDGAYLTSTPTSLNFYTQTMGTTSAAQTITIANNGYGGPATLQTLITGSAYINATYGTCGATLAVGASCNLSVTFSPTAPQSYTANVSVTGAMGSTPHSVISVSATGTGIPVVAQTGGSNTNNILIFNPAAVGISAASAQTLTATYTITGYTSAVTPVAAMHTGASYSVGTPACSGPVTALVCTVAVKFTPIYPGNRKDAVFLTVAGTRVATTLVDGIGQSPFALIQPGIVTMPILSNSNYLYTSIVDENLTAYVLQSEANSVLSVTSAGVVSTLPLTGLNSPRGVGIDGAGVLYIADQSSNGFFKTYDTVLGIQGTVSISSATTNTLQTLAVGNTGNVYSTDFIKVYTTLPNGTTTGVTISPAITQASEMAVDSNEDVFPSGYSTNEILANNAGQSVVNTTNAGSGIGIDAAGTLYLSRYPAFSAGSVGMLPASSYSTAIAELDPTASPLGNSNGPDGTVYVGNYTNLDKVSRSAGSFTFNALNPNQIATPQTAQIYNGGNMPLNLTSLTLTGDPDYTLSANGCTSGLVIAPGTLCSVTVNFTGPNHGGVFPGTITVITNSLNVTTTSTIALTDTIGDPYFTVSPTSLTFAPQLVGTTSAPQSVTITNMGAGTTNGDLYFFEASSGNTVITQFALTGSGCASIPVGGSCTVNVTFTPSTAGPYNDTGDAFPASGNPSPVTFGLIGTGIAPAVTFNPTSVTFSPQGVGTTSAPTVVQLTNSGTAPLTISAISLVGGYSAYFAQTNNCPISPSTLAVNASCNISVTFAPGSTVTYTGETLNVTDNATGSPQMVALSGTGVAAQLSVVPTSLTYAATVGTTSPPQNILVTNIGSSTISTLTLSLTGAGSANFTQTATTCTGTLAPSASCTATITFTPPSVGGPFTATFNAGTGTTTASTSLTGTGNAFIANPQLQFSADTLNLFAGIGGQCTSQNFDTGNGGQAILAGLCTAFTSATDPSGNVYIVDQQANTVRKITPAGIISTFAGAPAISGTYSGDNGQAALAGLNSPIDAISDASGNIFINDYGNNRIRKVNTTTGIITTIYGGSNGFFNGTTNPIPVGGGMTFDPSGNFYIAGGFSHTVIKVTPSGSASLFAGMMSNSGPGIAGYTGDGGKAYNATLNDPNAVASDLAGNIYIADTNNNVIRKVDTNGIITTYAGNGTQGYTGDGGPATSGEIYPYTVSSDLAGNLYVTGQPSSSSNAVVIRKVSSSGILSTVAGNGTGTVGGPAYSAGLTHSSNPRVDLNGDLIVPAFTQVFSVGPNAIVPFGAQSTGTTSAAQTITLQNTGNTTLTFTNSTYTATGNFAVTGGTCQGLPSLAIGATCTLTVTFSPTSATALTGTIPVPTNDAVTPQVINLTGTGTTASGPVLSVNPLSLAFTGVVGTPTATQTVTVSNTGNALFGISTIFIPSSSPFSVATGGTCSVGLTVNPNGSCTVLVTFDATTTGAATPANLGIGTFQLETGANITLTGTATGPSAALSPSPINFPSTYPGVTTAAQIVTLTNAGTTALPITSASANSTQFAVASTTCGTSLGAGASCTYSITFTANTTTGSGSATFSVVDSAGTQTVTLNTTTLSFVSNVGTALAAQPVSVLITTAGTLNAIQVLTQSVANIDFTLASGGTCATGTAYTVGQYCTVNVIFEPQSAGYRNGDVVLVNAAGNTLGLTFLPGTGIGPQVGFLPSSQTVLGGGFNGPLNVVVNGMGDVFVGDTYNYAVKEIAPGCITAGCVTTVAGSGFNEPDGIGTDPAGNIYIASPFINAISEILAVNGTFPASPTLLTLSSSFNGPYAVTADGYGNVYVADSGNNAVKEILAVNGTIPASPTIVTLGSGFSNPMGVAVDRSGNVFVADHGNSAVKEILAVNGTIPASPTIVTLGSGFSTPYGVTLDANNNLYVTDQGGGTLKELLAVNGIIPASPTIVTLSSSLQRPAGVAVDPNGNVYIANFQTSQVVELGYSAAPGVTFPTSTTVGSSDTTDNPQKVTVQNFGNASLTFVGIAVSTNFKVDTATTTCSTSTPLAAGASCIVGVDFAPTASGALTGTLTLTDNALNAAGTTQIISLSGTGVIAVNPQAVLTSSLAFSPTPVNTSAPTQTLTLSNPGASALTITSIVAAGAGFSQTNNCGASVAASGSCSIIVTFTPASATAFTGSVTVTDNATPTTQSATLTGTGTAPQAAFTTTVAFPSTVVNATAAAMVATLTNAGNVALPIASSTLTGSQFALTANTCGSSLAAGASCAYSITFTPTTTGAQIGTLTIVDSVGTQTTTITGTGVAAQAALSPTTFTFASTFMGTPSAPQVFTLSNSGTATLTGIAISLTGASPTAYSETTTCTATLAAAGSCTVSVIFTPAAANTYTASLNVVDSVGTQTATLSGTGNNSTGFVVVAPTPTQSVDPGGAAVFNINVNTLTGNFTLPVTLSASGLPTGATYTFTPASVIPGTTGAPSVLTIQTSPQFALRSPASNPALRMPLFAVLALLPLAGLRRIRRKLRTLSPGLRLLTLVLLSLAAILPLSGCGGGYFGQGPQAYVITVTGTSTAATQSTTVTLNLQ